MNSNSGEVERSRLDCIACFSPEATSRPNWMEACTSWRENIDYCKPIIDYWISRSKVILIYSLCVQLSSIQQLQYMIIFSRSFNTWHQSYAFVFFSGKRFGLTTGVSCHHCSQKFAHVSSSFPIRLLPFPLPSPLSPNSFQQSSTTVSHLHTLSRFLPSFLLALFNTHALLSTVGRQRNWGNRSIDFWILLVVCSRRTTLLSPVIIN